MIDAIPSLLVFVAANVAAAFSGAFFKPGTWYEELDKPWWRPPNWLFPIAWTLLYATIAVAGWMVWETGGIRGIAGVGLAIYALQLVLNAGWSAVFFGLRRPGWAFVEVIFLWLSIAATILVFYQVTPIAGLILLPYLVWVGFASVLNYSVWRRNPGGIPAGAGAQ